jgi:hypothetical protein
VSTSLVVGGEVAGVLNLHPLAEAVVVAIGAELERDAA